MTAVYPPNIKYRTEKEKTYVDNLEITLAKAYTTKGQPTKITPKTLAEYDISLPPDGWWASEKLDGIRALWNGKEFLSRGSAAGAAKVFSYVPQWFLDEMPKGVALDGEMWMGRGKFQEVSSISNLKPGRSRSKEQIDDLWKKVKYMIFDSPSIPGLYEERMGSIQDIINTACGSNPQCPLKWVKTVQITRGEKQLSKMFEKISSVGGEGLMLRAPKTPYIPKRTNLLLKIKIQEDAEGLVVGYTPGTGKYEGMVGSLDCILLENGKKTEIAFNVGTGLTDEMRKNIREPGHKYEILCDNPTDNWCSFWKSFKHGLNQL